MDTIGLFRELVNCGVQLDLCVYHRDGSCPEEKETVLRQFFRNGEYLAAGLEQGEKEQRPVLLGTSFGLVWGIDYLPDEQEQWKMVVLGPVFYLDVSRRVVEQRIGPSLATTVEESRKLIEAMQEIPVLSSPTFSRYLLMLHYCLVGEHLEASDIYQLGGKEEMEGVSPKTIQGDRYRIYMAEKALLRMVENGDLNYAKALSSSIGMSEGVVVQSKDPLRSAKNSVIVFTTLASRAAMHGGLPPEEAYSVGDAYIQAAENSNDFNEVSAIPIRMYEDFIQRVHRYRSSPSYSSEVRRCCDYIETHIDENVRAKDLARITGYTEYYLTEKFKKETGFTITNYSKFAKIERAKLLLETEDWTVQEIADELAFSSRNYFTKVFTEVVGMSPTEFRNKRGGE